jgi:hypothetical protein
MRQVFLSIVEDGWGQHNQQDQQVLKVQQETKEVLGLLGHKVLKGQ